MSQRALLRYKGETAPVDLNDLDDDLRRGRLPAAAELCYPPWTGEAFVRLGQIPELAEALDAPGARMARYLQRPPLPWASGAITAAVLTVGTAHMIWPALYALSPTLATPLVWLEERGATGYEPLLLDGAWWSHWTSQLLHGGPMHLFPNLAVVGYGGWRVEQALGGAGYLCVAAAAVLGGSLGMALTAESTVIGSSLIGYGVLGALLTIGFRFGDWIPPRQRRYYGFGNLALFAFLFISGLGTANAAHAGHAGGLLGGALAASLIRPESIAPAAGVAAARLRARIAAACLAIAPPILGLLLARVPALAFGAPQEIALTDEGVTLSVPARMVPPDPYNRADPSAPPARPYAQTVDGLPAWGTAPGAAEFVYAGLSRLRSGVDENPLAGQGLADRWARMVGGEWQVTDDAPPSLDEGWTTAALTGVDGESGERWRVVEHQRQMGRWLQRAGYMVRGEPGDRGPRVAVFEQILESAAFSEPPDLAEARAAHARSPRSPRLTLDLARELYTAGAYTDADALFADLIERDARRNEAMDWRIEMWGEHPGLFAPPARGAVWFAPWLAERPQRGEWQAAGLRWYLHHDRCEPARRLVERAELDPQRLGDCREETDPNE